jgi:hypothetical protein
MHWINKDRSVIERFRAGHRSPVACEMALFVKESLG